MEDVAGRRASQVIEFVFALPLLAQPPPPTSDAITLSVDDLGLLQRHTLTAKVVANGTSQFD
jgi:hypothetical protein